ncbi:hypothetical protein BU52_32290 [Streptomyces toyocaensis]|uniref:Uncharacterized protein n=1 Tax=Streptomyces toyocaensis TaxID=55952 RepID=A0A081XHW1_STRTO|nr:hypothetical protein [Streptomyces toyocaensis]KES03134.1 hypothetical protein BU52_32290 [Streptomyces toyocaensis]
MPTPGFPVGTLDSEGTPIWITDVATEDPHHSLHVVRGLDPAAALEALGAPPQEIRPCVLPDPSAKPNAFTSLPKTVLGTEWPSATLMAGSAGAWTFVYDDSGATWDRAAALSRDGRTAATSVYTLNADASLDYAVDGAELRHVDVDDLVLPGDLSGMPEELCMAFQDAGIFEADYRESSDEPDYSICMRAVCALGGLPRTSEDLRRVPLLAAAVPTRPLGR